MCDSNGIFNETMSCGSDEWCTGPSTNESAIALSGTDMICTKGNKSLLNQKIK